MNTLDMVQAWTFIFITTTFQVLTEITSAKITSDGAESAKKGNPFRKIKGPSSLNDRIAIVGAGPAGIHMAYKLQKAGFKNLTIYEKLSRIGGKSHTVYHRDTPHEMGTVYCQPDYTEIYKLVEEFRVGKLLPMTSPTLWETYNSSTSLPQYILRSVAEQKNISDPTKAAIYIREVVQKYIRLHKELFGDYDGELMPRPKYHILQNLNLTIQEYLKRHDLMVLEGFFLAAYTVQGYGHLDNVSAIYGLMWMTPTFLGALLPAPPSVKSYVKILENGFQNLWETIANQSNLHVILDRAIYKIRRSNNLHYLYFKNDSTDSETVEEFDFLILTPTLKDMLNITDFNDKERDLFSRTASAYYTTTLADTPYSSNRGQTPQNYYTYNVLPGRDMSVWVDRDSYSALNYIIGENYTEGVAVGGQDSKFIQSTVYYQYSMEKPNKQTLTTELEDHLKSQSNVTITGRRLQEIWPYFPRFSVSDMASGILWDIYDYQGQQNTWYIGSSVSFESVKSVVEYNNLLLRHFDIPSNVINGASNLHWNMSLSSLVVLLHVIAIAVSGLE